MSLKRHLRTAALVLISGASLVLALYVVDVDATVSALAEIPVGAVGLAGLLIFANSVFAVIRFRAVLGNFGYQPTWGQITLSFTIGQVSNQVLFNVIGQSLSRAAILNSAGVPFSISVLATYWERLIAAGLLFFLSAASALVLFFKISINVHEGGAYLLSLLVGITIVSAVTVAVVIRSKDFDFSIAYASRFLFRLWPSALLTLIAHLAMLGAYAVLLMGLQVKEMTIEMMAALTIVMFAAALPISLSGWGIRELSAAQALGAIGVDPRVAVASAIVIGLLGLLIIILGAAIGLYLYVKRKRVFSVPSRKTDAHISAESWGEFAILGAAVLSSILLFFQIRLPLPHGEITANAADILALTGVGFLLFRFWTKRNFGPLPAGFVGGITAITVLFVFGLAISYFRFGSNSWGLFNRGLGWLIIIGYIAMGTAAVTSNPGGGRLVLRVFGIAGVTVAAQQLILLLVAMNGFKLPTDVFMLPMRAYASNSNAFAFQMIMAAACLETARRLDDVSAHQRFYDIAFIVVALAIYYTHSRSGLGMLVILLVLLVTFSTPAHRRRAIRLCAITGFVLTIALFLADIFQLLHFALANLLTVNVDMLKGGSPMAPLLSVAVERTSSDNERWLSIIEGWNLWLKHPVFGAGLGGYVQERLAAGRGFLVIHSIPVWLMAEMGLLGLLVAGIFLALLLNGAFQLLAKPATHSWGLGLLIILVCMTTSGLVHDLFFQRSFWFLLGLYVAAGFAIAKEGSQKPDL